MKRITRASKVPLFKWMATQLHFLWGAFIKRQMHTVTSFSVLSWDPVVTNMYRLNFLPFFLFFIATWSMSDFLWQYQYAIWKRDKSVIWKCYPDMITNSLTYLLTKKFMASRKKKVLRDLNTTRLRCSRVTIPCRAWRQTVVSRSHLRQLWLYRTLRYFFEGP